MANKLSQEKTEAMWAAFLERQNNSFVSRKCRVSTTTVRRYRRLDNWDERYRKIQEETQKRSDETVAERRARSRKIIRAAIAQIGRLIAEGKLKYSAMDLERLVRLDEFLDGLPEKKTLGDLPDRTSDILKEIIRRMESGEIGERAASTIAQLCSHILRAKEQEEFEARLEAIEERVEKEINAANQGNRPTKSTWKGPG